MNLLALEHKDFQKKLDFFAFLAVVILAPLATFVALAWDVKIILIVLGLIIITTLSFFKRELCLYIVTFIIPIENVFFGVKFHDAWAVNCDLMPVFPLLVLVATTGVLMRKTAKLDDADFATPVNVFLAIFVLWLCIGVLWTPNLYHTLFQLFILVSCIAMFYLVVVSLGKNEVVHMRAVMVFIFVAVIYGGLSIWSMHFLENDITGSYKLLYGLSLDYALKHSDFRAKALATPNNMALILNTAIALSFGLLPGLTSKMKRYFLFITISFLIYGVLETKSKAGVGSLLFLIMFSLTTFNYLRAKFTRNALLFLSLIVVLFVGQSIAENRTPRIIASEQMSANARKQIWSRGLHEFTAKAPGLGLGVGGLRYYADPMPHAHSVYFSILYDFGLIGVILLAGFLITLVVKLLNLIRHQNTYPQMMLVASAGCLLVILVHGLVDFWYLHYLIWWSMGMLVATIILAENELQLGSKVNWGA